jgi:hypothetical protein
MSFSTWSFDACVWGILSSARAGKDNAPIETATKIVMTASVRQRQKPLDAHPSISLPFPFKDAEVLVKQSNIAG